MPAQQGIPYLEGRTRSKLRFAAVHVVWTFLVLAALWVLARSNYPLFHSTVEGYSVLAAAAVFWLAWVSRRVATNGYLAILGAGMLPVAVILVLHLFAYPGVDVIADPSGNVAAQLWLSASYLLAATMLTAAVLARRPGTIGPFITTSSALGALLAGSVLVWRIFPAAYVPSQGFTVFYVASECVAVAVLAVAALFLYRVRDTMDTMVARVTLTATGCFALTGILLTLDASGLSITNIFGHILQLAGFILLTLGIVRTTIERPMNTVFAELNASESRYRALAEGSPLAIFVNRNDKVVLANSACVRLFGASSPEELIGKSTLELFHPDSQALVRERIREATETAPLVEARIVRLDGMPVDVEATASPLPGQGVSAFQVVLRDITERKHAEDALRESERRFRTMFDLLPEGVAALDADGVIIFANPALERMLAISQEGLRQGVSRSSNYIRSDGTPMPREEFPSFITRNEGRAVHGVETGIVKEDGSVVWVSASASPVALADWSTIVVATDITERKAAADELAAYRQSLETLVEARTADLEEANRQLREATAAKSEFLASMSHELRTPLNSVIGFSGILSGGLAGPLTDEQRTQVGMINVAGRHLLSLVDDILDLAKIEAGRVEVHVEPVDVAVLVQAVVDAIGPLAQEAGLELRAETDECRTTLHSDSGKIRQILFNLIGNAVKFTEHGSVVVAVRSEPDGAFSFAVSDTGHGIAEQDMTRIFTAFTQVPVSVSGKSKGTGLGLRISREYAHMLGGEITVQSEVGVGSTFTLTLPAEPPSPVSPDAVERG